VVCTPLVHSVEYVNSIRRERERARGKWEGEGINISTRGKGGWRNAWMKGKEGMSVSVKGSK
jgi:hypothetical protein